MSYEKKILREGWFDKIASFFKGEGDDAQRLANAWLGEKEIEVGHDFDNDFKQQVLQYVTNRYERALKTYADTDNPQRKSVSVIVALLDRRFSGYIDELIDVQDPQATVYRKRR